MTQARDSTGRYDVVVVGAGAGGMAAALVAALEGAQVCLVEKEPVIGGTTAWSGGMVWAPGVIPDQPGRPGAPDDGESVTAYLASLIPGAARDPRLAAFRARAPAALAYLARRSQVKLRRLARYPDYYQDRPGASLAGRVFEPEPFDAARLGARLSLLRRPLPEFALFGDMMVARPDLARFRAVFKAPAAFARVAGLLARHAWQKLRHGRGTSLVLGNALAARFLASLDQAGVEIRTACPAASLLRDDRGRVIGLALQDGARLYARRGVVLATGGFGHEPARRAALLPPALADHSATAPGAAGDGLRLGQAAGAAIAQGTVGNGFWAPVSCYVRADGSRAVYPHTVTDRAKPGLIAVDATGQRFVNEALSYHAFVEAMLAGQLRAPSASAWLIADRKFLWRYGLGAVKPMALSTRRFRRQGYLIRARSIAALARALGLDACRLQATLTRYNRFAASGEDPDFGKGGDAYQRFLGDAAVSPNPCLAPIETPPFYAVEVTPGDLGTAAGLATDSDGRVCDPAGRPIAGLFACGNDMLSVMQGAYPGPGITLGPAIVFGYAAALAMVRQGSPPEPALAKK